MTNQSPITKVQTISVIPHLMRNLYKWIPAFARMTFCAIIPLFIIHNSSFVISTAFAQERGGIDKEGRAGGDIVGTINPPQTVIGTIGDTGNFISAIVRFITVIAGLYALWQFITGGLGFITSGGDKGKIQTATSQIMMAITGLVVIGMSFILASIIGRLLFGAGFNLLSPSLQTVR